MNTKLQFNLQNETFVVPINPSHKSKPSKSSRSDSFPRHQHQQSHQPVFVSGLHAAASDPALSSSNSNSALLQQLLTPSSNSIYYYHVFGIIQSLILIIISKDNNMLNKQTSSSTSSLQMYGQQKSTTQSHQSSNSFNSSSIDQQIMSYSPTSPVTITPSHSPELMIDSKAPINLDSPTSPSRCGTGNGGSNSSRFPPREARRATHIHAEQKRRYNIKNGFDTLHSLIPQLQQNPNAKVYDYYLFFEHLFHLFFFFILFFSAA